MSTSVQKELNSEIMEEGPPMERPFPAEDRISELPDMLRQHILCLLPRKEAAKTSLLSKSWNGFWKTRFSHPTILSFGRTYHNERDQNVIANQIEQFMSEHAQKKIDIFQLYFNPGLKYNERTRKWIQQAVRNGVEELYLDFSQGNLGTNPSGRLTRNMKRFELKEDMFKSNNSLLILSLSFCNLPRTFKFVHYSSLETIYFHGVNLNDRMFGKLVTNCTQLKCLELRECLSLFFIKVRPRYLRLHKLTIVNCRNIRDINIGAGSLHTLQLYGTIPNVVLQTDEKSALRSVIMISTMRDHLSSLMNRPFVFVPFEHVEVLTLCCSSLEIIGGSAAPSSLVCANVRELQLVAETMNTIDLVNMYTFFRESEFPNLERMFVELPTSLLEPALSCILENVAATNPKIFEHLKIVKMKNFKGHRNEIRLLELVLRAAINLELIILMFPQAYDELNHCAGRGFFLINQLMLSTRASPTAQMMTINASEDDHMMIKPMQSKVIGGFRSRRPQIGPRF